MLNLLILGILSAVILYLFRLVEGKETSHSESLDTTNKATPAMNDSTMKHQTNDSVILEPKTYGGKTMPYQYKMVQIPQDVTVKMKEQSGNEAAAYLEAIANEQAAKGWEFYRVDEVGVLAQPGCLGRLIGRSAEYTVYYVVTFRLDKQ